MKTKKTDYKLLAELFMTFFKIGAFTIGGGFAMIPHIQHEIVDKKGWASEEEMTDYLILAQSSPGVIAINSATAIGHRIHGFGGALISTSGIVLPSFAIIVLIAALLGDITKQEHVAAAFKGVRAAVAGLMVLACIRLAKTSVRSAFQIVVAAAAFLALVLLGIEPQYIILAAAVIGVVYYSYIYKLITKREGERENA